MQNWIIVAITLGIFALLTVIELILGAKHPLRKAFLNILLGIVALIGVNIVSIYTGVHITVSYLSLFVSAIGGIPGVTAMVLINTL